MKLASYMVGGSVVSASLITALSGVGIHLEIWLGMIAPAAVAGGEWIATERTIKRAPDLLASLMLKIFIVKTILFAAYVTGVLALGPVRPAPFVASFVFFFVVLFITEAVALHRLTARQMASS